MRHKVCFGTTILKRENIKLRQFQSKDCSHVIVMLWYLKLGRLFFIHSEESSREMGGLFRRAGRQQ